MRRTLADLADVVAPRVLLDAIETSTLLARLGVPHALIGGLAVGVHGHPRATKDVDFLVGLEAFERMHPLLLYRAELREIVRVGQIDLLAPPDARADLLALLRVPRAGDVPVIPIEALVELKLEADRPQDRADVAALVAAGASVDAIATWLRQHAPSLLPRLFERLA